MKSATTDTWILWKGCTMTVINKYFNSEIFFLQHVLLLDYLQFSVSLCHEDWNLACNSKTLHYFWLGARLLLIFIYWKNVQNIFLFQQHPTDTYAQKFAILFTWNKIILKYILTVGAHDASEIIFCVVFLLRLLLIYNNQRSHYDLSGEGVHMCESVGNKRKRERETLCVL